jgi:hypothetical protein
MSDLADILRRANTRNFTSERVRICVAAELSRSGRSRQLCFPCLAASVLVVSCVLAAAARAEEVPSDVSAFTEAVAVELRQQVGEAGVTVKGPLTLGLGDLQLNLDRVFAFCRGNAAGCRAQVDGYVRGAAETYRNVTAPPAKSSVRLVVRTSEYVAAIRSVPEGTKPVAIQPRPFADGLVVLPVLDSPRTVRYLAESDNAKLEMTADEVYQLGLTNLIKELRPLMEVAKVAKHGRIGELTGNVYDPSRLVLLDTWAPLVQAQAGVLIVAIPATDAVFYVGEDTPKAIDALRTLTRTVLERAPGKLSGNLYRWRATGWERVAP